MNPEQQLTQSIMDEKQLEADAKKAKDLLNELSAVMNKMQDLAKSCGAANVEPVSFCKNIILTYGLKKLDDKIITL